MITLDSPEHTSKLIWKAIFPLLACATFFCCDTQFPVLENSKNLKENGWKNSEEVQNSLKELSLVWRKRSLDVLFTNKTEECVFSQPLECFDPTRCPDLPHLDDMYQTYKNRYCLVMPVLDITLNFPAMSEKIRQELIKDDMKESRIIVCGLATEAHQTYNNWSATSCSYVFSSVGGDLVYDIDSRRLQKRSSDIRLLRERPVVFSLPDIARPQDVHNILKRDEHIASTARWFSPEEWFSDMSDYYERPFSAFSWPDITYKDVDDMAVKEIVKKKFVKIINSEISAHFSELYADKKTTNTKYRFFILGRVYKIAEATMILKMFLEKAL